MCIDTVSLPNVSRYGDILFHLYRSHSIYITGACTCLVSRSCGLWISQVATRSSSSSQFVACLSSITKRVYIKQLAYTHVGIRTQSLAVSWSQILHTKTPFRCSRLCQILFKGNFGDTLVICQIHENFLPPKFCIVWYLSGYSGCSYW